MKAVPHEPRSRDTESMYQTVVSETAKNWEFLGTHLTEWRAAPGAYAREGAGDKANQIELMESATSGLLVVHLNGLADMVSIPSLHFLISGAQSSCRNKPSIPHTVVA